MGIDNEAKLKANERQSILVKPQGSLGVLEEISIKLAGITGNVYNHLDKRVVVIFSSDNGICQENVASAPQSVTAAQTINFLRGITAIPVIAKANGCDIKVYNVGVKENIHHPKLVDKCIRKGTYNMLKKDAMTREEAETAIQIGIDCVAELVSHEYKIIGIGEMGIGNTSTSTCIVSALTSCSIEDAIGRGGGLTDEQLQHKNKVLNQVMINRAPNRKDPMDVLHKVGGFDIAAMVGVCIGAKKYSIPVVIDGFISMVAALVAYKIDKDIKEYMFASHFSLEKGYNIAINEIGLKPMLDLNMRLGEGSGCPIAMNIINTAVEVMNNMATFEEASIDIKDYENLWEGVKI
jgi:nicotinate-nucleotide--dimethylbenzimidazole phosphoribosyltransferase